MYLYNVPHCHWIHFHPTVPQSGKMQGYMDKLLLQFLIKNVNNDLPYSTFTTNHPSYKRSPQKSRSSYLKMDLNTRS